ncbi:MAG: monovalent cation/H(+) antiporter subunit G [Actinomycetota bacterium]|nr:monovalent cation/H(+) antiporter subunit G [Actinomycetota bacterium]
MRAALAVALLVVGGAAQVIACLGVARMRAALDRLHYTGASVLAVVAVALAILVDHGFSMIADKALVLAAFVLVSSPVVVQVLARAIRISGRGELDPDGPDVERLP